MELLQVSSSQELRKFIRFPFQIYKHNPFWLPPILLDEKQFFNPKKNKALRNSETILFLALNEGKICGRIMGIISPSYNELTAQKRARFFKFECIDDQETAHLLIEAIESWALSKGMNEVIGPFGFSDKDPQGLLIMGYDLRAVFLAPYNLPYYTGLIENEGYNKEVDLFEYMIPVPDKIPDFYSRIYERISRNNNLECVSFKNKKDLKPFIIPVLELMNETFRDIFGSYELDREEMEKFASDYMTIVDVDFVKVVTEKGKVVSFFIAIPDIGPGIQKSRGKLFPFGFIHILRQMKKTDFLVLMLGGIKPTHQGIGLDVLM
ncbi:MAG: hypothetical protein HGA23_08800, partial [Bacteroidales bacterium]|nr:hypothetical protein [Bacteroidales bacterium]